MEKFYKIAGLTVQMDSFGRTVEQAKPYVCAPVETPDLIIQSAWKALQERQPHLSDDDCEYLSTGSCFYSHLLQFDGLLIHASAVVVDGKAYLFSAPCGTGKSTHTQLWLKVFGDRATILNDDKPALRCEDGVWYAYGTPWCGKEGYSTNASVPIKGICFIERAQENTVRKINASEALTRIFHQLLTPDTAEGIDALFPLIDRVLCEIPCYVLGCNISEEAAEVAYKGMND